jgi:MerR family mercuric resistance operon transcriptional regulator
MHDLLRELTIGALAQSASVNVETIRFYQRKGLLQEPRRPAGGIRRYGPPDVERVNFIKAAQRLGFSLGEVADLLVLEDGTHCAEARRLAEKKLDDVSGKIADLQRMRSALSRLVRECGAARGTVACPMVAALRLR